jgi:hypothetical protein
MTRDALSLDSSLPLFAAVLQAYETRVGDGFVMAGNEALVVCSLPAHTAQFLQVAAWITNEGVEISPSAAAPGQETTRMRSIVVHYFLPHFFRFAKELGGRNEMGKNPVFFGLNY